MPTAQQIREQFPGLTRSSDVLLDNAGGSQVPACVADAIRDYMLSTYVQLGADYQTSKRSTFVGEAGGKKLLGRLPRSLFAELD